MSQQCPLGFTFDSNLVEPRAPQIVRPAGNYPVKLESARWVQSKNNPEVWFVELTFVVTRGEHAGAEFVDRLNLMHPNEAAKENAQRTLSAICRSTGVAVITDVSALCGKPLLAHVRVRPGGKGADGNDYGESNEIKGYSVDSDDKPASPFPNFQQAPGAAPAPAPQPQQQQQAPAPGPFQQAPQQGQQGQQGPSQFPPFATAPGAGAPGPGPASGAAPQGRVPWGNRT